MIILKNCRLVKELTEGFEKKLADLLIKGEMISDIQEPGFNFEHPEATILDLKGKTLLPGLIDLHVHFDDTAGDVLEENMNNDAFRVLQAVKFAQQTLNAGFTTIRDVGARNRVNIDLRNAINQGYIKGPRIHACGHMITPTEAGNEFFGGMYNEADGVDEVRKATRQEIAAGADFVKYMGTGAMMNPGGEPRTCIYEMDELKELVKIAKAHGKYVAGHNHAAEAIKRAIIAGVRTIEHGSLVDDESIELLKKEESYLVPTLTVTKALAEKTKGNASFMGEKANRIIKESCKQLKKAYKEGLKLGFGTDQGTCNSFHGDNANEFIYRYEMLDMNPIDIIVQATKYSAEIIGLEALIGTIKIGKCADLVVIDGNPTKDIKLMKSGVVHVIHKGEIIR